MRTSLAAAASAVCLTVGVAPGADAGQLVHEDARRDVVKLEFDEGVKQSAARQRLDPDIRRITIDYRQGALVIRTKYAAMERRVGRMEFTTIRTRGNVYSAQVQVNRRGHWQGFKMFMGGETEDQNVCPTAKHRFDYDADVSIWTIPPVCLDRARWVQIAQGAMYFGGETGFLDHAFGKGMPRRPQISARVWRG